MPRNQFPCPTVVGYSCPGCQKVFDTMTKLNVHKAKRKNPACHTKSVQRDVWAVHEETGTGRLQTQVMGPHANGWQAVAEGNTIVPQADCCIVQLHCHFVFTTLLSMFWKYNLLYLYHIVNGQNCYCIATALFTMLLPCFESARGHFSPPSNNKHTMRLQYKKKCHNAVKLARGAIFRHGIVGSLKSLWLHCDNIVGSDVVIVTSL